MSRRLLPKQVKVGPYVFLVEEKDRDWFMENKMYGRMNPLDMTIEVCTEMDTTILMDTFLHEVMHAVYFVYNIYDKDDEERTVTALATGFSQVLIDNPGVGRSLDRLSSAARKLNKDTSDAQQ